MDSQSPAGLSAYARRTRRLVFGLDCAVIRRSIRSWEWIPIACHRNGTSRAFRSISATVDFSHRAKARRLAAHREILPENLRDLQRAAVNRHANRLMKLQAIIP